MAQEWHPDMVRQQKHLTTANQVRLALSQPECMSSGAAVHDIELLLWHTMMTPDSTPPPQAWKLGVHAKPHCTLASLCHTNASCHNTHTKQVPHTVCSRKLNSVRMCRARLARRHHAPVKSYHHNVSFALRVRNDYTCESRQCGAPGQPQAFCRKLQAPVDQDSEQEPTLCHAHLGRWSLVTRRRGSLRPPPDVTDSTLGEPSPWGLAWVHSTILNITSNPEFRTGGREVLS